jgi:hypothetical protein
MALRYFDLAAFAAMPLVRRPFDYIFVPDFVRQDVRNQIDQDYPKIAERGSHPVGQHSFGPRFQELLDELESNEFRRAFEDKFEMNLSRRPTMITVRGQCSAEDGKVHTDSKNKILTVLIYMNSGWQAPGGRLRALGSQDDLDDVVAEIPPTWTLFAFKRADNAWHGHKPFVGERRVVQLHWVTSQWYRQSQLLRHHYSAFIKRAAGAHSIRRWRIS